MAKKETQEEPSGSLESETIQGGDISTPTEMPPLEAEEQLSVEGPETTIEGIGDMAPSLPVEADVMAGVAAWQNNKRVTALWSINQNCNSYAGISGMGWKKLANNSASAIVALTMLCSHAREKNSVVNFREEGGMIREMYVW